MKYELKYWDKWTFKKWKKDKLNYILKQITKHKAKLDVKPVAAPLTTDSIQTVSILDSVRHHITPEERAEIVTDVIKKSAELVTATMEEKKEILIEMNDPRIQATKKDTTEAAKKLALEDKEHDTGN